MSEVVKTEEEIDLESKARHSLAVPTFVKAVFAVCLFLLSKYLFDSTMNSGQFNQHDVSLSVVAKVVVYYCLILFTGLLTFYNILLAIREMFLSRAILNYLSLILGTATLVLTIKLVIDIIKDVIK